MSLNCLIVKSEKLRRSGCYWQAQDIYATIVDKLRKEMAETSNEKLKRRNQGLISDYVIRMQHLEFEIDYNGFQSLGEIKETVVVPDNVTDFDLAIVLAKYADAQLKEVIVYQRKLNKPNELKAFHKLTRILQRACPHVHYIKLKCHRDGETEKCATALAQSHMFREFENNWPFENIRLSIQVVASTFMDHYKIVYNNGHVFFFENSFQQFTGENKSKAVGESGISQNKIIIWNTNVLEKYAGRY